MKEAMFYDKLKGDIVSCHLCPHHCVIAPKEWGKCGVRRNLEGKLYSLNYGRVVSAGIDPIEKKPLFHFLPGTKTFSIAAAGCNMSCSFCQNWEISQRQKEGAGVMGRVMKPEEIVDSAVDSGASSISYTYTEPTIFLEYALEAAKLAKENGLKNVFVSNGFITKEAIERISPYLDAINIDLKAFSEDFYERICGARLMPVLEAIKKYHEKGMLVELTTLIIPGENDSEGEFEKIAGFIAGLSKRIPWHISRFFPMHRMDGLRATPIETVHKAIDIGRGHGLCYVYAGNAAGDISESTYCPICGERVIERTGLAHVWNKMSDGSCARCGARIDVVLE